MSSTDTILVVVDPRAKHHAALAKGALLAQKLQARIDLFASSNSAQTAFVLPSFAKPLRDLGLEVTTQAADGDAFRVALAERLKHTRPKLVIKDVQPRASLTDSDWQLMRSCPVALLLSKPTLWPERPQICAAIDPGYSHRAHVALDHIVLEQGSALATQLGGELHVLHAYLPPAFVVTMPADDCRTLEYSHELVIAQCHARLRSLKTIASGYGVPASQVHVTIGPVCDAVSSLVSELKASIVVMSAVSRSDLRRDVIGSTAEALLKQIRCDVLVVKAPEAAMSLH